MIASFLFNKRRLFALFKRNLTEEEAAIIAYVGDGRVNKDEIRRVFNLDNRTFYATIEKIRRKGVWLVASKEKGNSGYYIANNRNELEEWISKQYKMIESNTRTYQAMRNGMSEELVEHGTKRSS